MQQVKAGIIMGSISDLYVMKEAANVLKTLNIDFEINIVSAHRTPEKLYEYARGAKEKGIDVIIAGAGGSAHLPGMVASVAYIPVIGVPVRSKTFDGIDSLLSIVQMPKGIPVATVPINGGYEAGILAAKLLTIKDENIHKKLSDFINNSN